MYLDTCFPVDNAVCGGDGAIREADTPAGGSTSLGQALIIYNIAQNCVLAFSFLSEDEIWSLYILFLLSCHSCHYRLSSPGTLR